MLKDMTANILVGFENTDEWDLEGNCSVQTFAEQVGITTILVELHSTNARYISIIVSCFHFS
jgi:hypothetical protein